MAKRRMELTLAGGAPESVGGESERGHRRKSVADDTSVGPYPRRNGDISYRREENTA